MAVAPTPVAAAPDAPDRAQRATFSARATAFFDWIKNTFVAGVNALASNVYANAQDAASSAANAVAQSASATAQAGIATAQAAAATSAAATATTQAGVATTQAASITTAAATSTAKADVATAKAAEATAAAATATAVTLGVSTGYPAMRPTLNLDFANARSVDPRITFTRASTATRVNERGLIETVASGVPRIDHDPITLACLGLLPEEQRTNLLTYSEDFNTGSFWQTSKSVSQSVSPAGSVGVVKLVENTSSNNHNASTPVSVASGATYCFSVFVKAVERTAASIDLNSNNSAFTQAGAVYNLTTGALLGTSGTPTAHGCIPLGNGWFRLWITGVATATATAYPSIGSSIGASYSYAGDGSSGIYIWGAQIEAGATPSAYIPSSVTHTGRASTATYIGSNGLIQTAASGAARYSYNPLNLAAAPALLLEAAATNLLTRSGEVGGTDWAITSTTSTAPGATAPDGAATARLISDTSGSVAGWVDQYITVADDSSTYVLSMYVKAGTSAQSSMRAYLVGGSSAFANGARLDYNWSTGVATTSFDAVGGGVIDVGNGWKRLYVLIKNNSTGNTSFVARLLPDNSSVGATGNCYAWGAQVEVGTYPTSYIPTTSATVTRAADTSTSAATTRAADLPLMTGTNFSSWFRPDEGTFIVSTSAQHTANTHIFDVTRGTGGWGPRLQLTNPSVPNIANVNDSLGVDVSAALAGSALSVTAVAYKTNDYALTVNGSAVYTDMSASVPTSLAELRLGVSPVSTDQLNGHIRSLRYYPKRLTNAELQTITQG